MIIIYVTYHQMSRIQYQISQNTLSFTSLWNFFCDEEVKSAIQVYWKAGGNLIISIKAVHIQMQISVHFQLTSSTGLTNLPQVHIYYIK